MWRKCTLTDNRETSWLDNTVEQTRRLKMAVKATSTLFSTTVPRPFERSENHTKRGTYNAYKAPRLTFNHPSRFTITWSFIGALLLWVRQLLPTIPFRSAVNDISHHLTSLFALTASQNYCYYGSSIVNRNPRKNVNFTKVGDVCFCTTLYYYLDIQRRFLVAKK